MRSAVQSVALLRVAIYASSLAVCAQEPCKPPEINVSTPEPNIFSAQQEELLGDVLAQKVLYLRVTDDQAITAYLAAIGDRLARSLPPNQFHYRYFVVDSPGVNAFSIAGGRIYITRGLIAQLRNSDEAAAILAHEMGHVVTHQTAIEVTFLLQQVLAVTSVTDRQDIQRKLDDLESNWRRDPSAFRKVAHRGEQNQLQADEVGLYALTAAGYSPEAFPAVFDRIASTGGNTGGWLSDLLHTTTPEQLRLREMLKSVEALPSSCIAHPPGNGAGDFERWRMAVLDFAGWGKSAASLHGVLAQVKLDPLPQGIIQSIRFSPDGRYLLAQKSEEIFVFTREPLAFLFSIHAPDAWQPRFTPDSKSVAFAGTGARVEVWDIASQKRVRLDEPQFASPCTTTVLSSDAGALACLRGDGTLDLVRLPSSTLVAEKKRFRQPPRAKGMTLFLTAHMDFSPDGHYFVAYGDRGAAVIDVTNGGEVSLPWRLKNAIRNGFVFPSKDRLLVWPSRGVPYYDPLLHETYLGLPSPVAPVSVEVPPAILYGFPSGEKLDQIPMGRAPNVEPITHGNYLLVGPLPKPPTQASPVLEHRPIPEQYPLGILDLNSKKILHAIEYRSADVYDEVYLHQTLGGDLGLYDMSTGKLKARTAFPPGELGSSYGHVTVSSDLKWLAASAGAVWDLASGKMFYHLRPFQLGRFEGDSAFYATFPAYRETPRTLVRFDLTQRGVTPVEKVNATHGVQYGAYLVVTTPHQTTAAQGMFSPCQWKYHDFDPMDCDVTMEVRDAQSDRVLWSRRFPKETPRVLVESDQGLMILWWSASAAAVADEIKDHPELADAWTPARKRPGAALLEVVSLRDGSVRRGMSLDNAMSGSIRMAGERLLAAHSGYTEVFSLATGAKEGEIPGWPEALAASGGILSVREDSENEVEIYDLNSRTRLDDFTFPVDVEFEQFSTDGKRLLVLTADQTAYVLDTSVHRP